VSAAASASKPAGPSLKVVYKSSTKPTWCPGCGDYGVVAAVERALQTLQIPPHEVLIVSGIGCSSNLPHFLSTYGFHAIHGRAIPVAEGARLANHKLHVIVTGGDGDGYGIGLGHALHAMRRNIDLTYIVMNNEIYGLTTGQASPTSLMGHKTKSTPQGVIEEPVNPLALALAAGATYVARGFSGDVKHLSDLVANGLRHRGFALVDVLSPCVTYNHLNTFDYFRQRVYKLETASHDPSNLLAAYEKAHEWGDRIPTGLFYRTERPTYEDLEESLQAGPLVEQKAGLRGQEALLDEFI
jgi:2-oxoglutarate ferredoxin oxidoreductase subunit beta